MGRPARCCGCSHPIRAADAWCTPCELRMPRELQARLRDAQRALDAARAEAVQWLGQHPHATGREIEVIALGAQGAENEQIGQVLHLSVHTVRDHWRRLMARWGCANRTQVVATAFHLGYLRIEDGPELKAVRAA